MNFLITGSNKGIGFSIAKRLVASELVSTVTITSRDAERAKKAR